MNSQGYEETSRPARRTSCLGAMIGGTLALVCVLAAIVIWFRSGRLPEINQQQLDDALAAWQSVAPPSYNIQTTVSGPQPGVYTVQVRDHKVVNADRNGAELKQKRTMGTWSVPGMFDTIESDLKNSAEDTTDRLTPESPRVTARATFHPQWHYPERYQRIQWGSQVEVNWSVTQFEVIESSAGR